MDKFVLLALLGFTAQALSIKQGFVSNSGSSSSSSSDDDSLVQQSVHKWTNMDSAIRDAEGDILFGAQRQEDLRKEGKLTTITGFNDQYDPSVTKYHQNGDAAMDDDYLKSVFHRYYTTKAGEFPKGERFLTKENAWLASKEIVMKWNNIGAEQAEEYLNQKFERAWYAADVNNLGKIRIPEAYNFEKSIMGSFWLTYTE